MYMCLCRLYRHYGLQKREQRAKVNAAANAPAEETEPVQTCENAKEYGYAPHADQIKLSPYVDDGDGDDEQS